MYIFVICRLWRAVLLNRLVGGVADEGRDGHNCRVPFTGFIAYMFRSDLFNVLCFTRVVNLLFMDKSSKLFIFSLQNIDWISIKLSLFFSIRPRFACRKNILY